MFTELRDYRELLFTMTRRDLVLAGPGRAVMGFAWAIFIPVINTIVFTVNIRRVARIETDVPYPFLVTAGCCPESCSRRLSRQASTLSSAIRVS